jgi:DNA (cytosine-5)-methyltransferase 1
MSRHDMTELEPRTDGVSNTLTSVQKDNLVAEPIIIDDYNQRVPQDQDVIGTITTNVGNSAPRNGYKIAEPLRIPQATKQDYIEVPQGAVFDMSYPESTTRRGRVQEGGQVSPTLMAGGEAPCHYDGKESTSYRIRKLTPRECFRLMGVDDKDIDTIQASGVSNSQQYKMAGNSIVVDVLYHLFRKMFTETHSEDRQLTLF